jgi:hypothetical protein
MVAMMWLLKAYLASGETQATATQPELRERIERLGC